MTAAEAKFLLDPYLDWAKREGLPVHEDAVVDLAAAETGPWPRLGERCQGAFVHLPGRGDWMTVFLLDLPPGGASAPQRHLFDEVFYVLSGSGRIAVETPDGGELAHDFGPLSLFAPPLNARYRIVNGSAQAPARLACVNDLRILMNIFHDEAFFFDNPFAFPERQGASGRGNGRGNMRAGFVSDVSAVANGPTDEVFRFELPLGASSMAAQLCAMPPGSREAARRADAGLHVLCLEGAGHTLLRIAGHAPVQRVDWRPGSCFALPEHMLHEHVNSGGQAARHLALGFGTRRHPIVHARRLGLQDIAPGQAGADGRQGAMQ